MTAIGFDILPTQEELDRKHEVESYAAQVLADAGCDRYTYGGEQAQYVLDDLKKAFPNGMKYPYVTVANAILEISRPRPIVREPWKMIWDNDNATDGVGYETFEAAKDAALDTLAAWAAQARAEWVREKPNTDEKYDWDYMVCHCSVQVQKYDPDTDEYEDYWEPSHEDEQQVGWLEWKELRKTERSK